MISKEDLQSLDVKGKILIVKSNNPSKVMMEQLRKKLYGIGCLGIVCIDRDASIEDMGIKELKRIVEKLDNMNEKGEENE